MIPVSDRLFIFTSRKPTAVYWLIGINIAIFFWELKLEFSGQLASFINRWCLIPAQISEAIAQVVAGNFAAGLFLLSRSSSLLSGMFIHGSFSQIVGNLIFLWVFGRNLNNILGQRKFLGLYLAGGVFTQVMQLLAHPSSLVPLMGGNGAIASVLGAYVFKFPKVKIDTILPIAIVFVPVQIPAFFHIFSWFVQLNFYGVGSLSIPGGVIPHNFYWTQGAGLVFGALSMRVLQKRMQR